MMKTYKQFDSDDRKRIEEGLNKKLSFRKIAELLGRSASSISREIKANREVTNIKPRKVTCRDKKTCKKHMICVASCKNPEFACACCPILDCREVCHEFLERERCLSLECAPWVCNGCKKRARGCLRPRQHIYDALIADSKAKDRRSAMRSGVNHTEEDFKRLMAIVRPAIKRGMSPYEIAISYADTCKVSVSTLYRWIERGYGNMCNLDLERKAGFRPRRKHIKHKITHHGSARSYDKFCELSKEERMLACEMDTVIGKKSDTQCLLTLYLRPSHMQFCLLLREKTKAEVVKVIDSLEEMCGKELFEELFGVLLTDNGTEFEDPTALEKSLHFSSKRCRVFYCDPRQSQQKGSCEKAHTELRQILPKGQSVFDALSAQDVAVLNSQVNSTPRRILNGLSPLKMLKTAYGERIAYLLDALGIVELGADGLCLKPSIMPDEVQGKQTDR